MGFYQLSSVFQDVLVRNPLSVLFRFGPVDTPWEGGTFTLEAPAPSEREGALDRPGGSRGALPRAARQCSNCSYGLGLDELPGVGRAARALTKDARSALGKLLQGAPGKHEGGNTACNCFFKHKWRFCNKTHPGKKSIFAPTLETHSLKNVV